MYKHVQDGHNTIKSTGTAGYFPYICERRLYNNAANNDFPLKDTWNAGISLNIPIFSGLATSGQVAEAKANLAVVQANAQLLRSQISVEVKQVLANYHQCCSNNGNGRG